MPAYYRVMCARSWVAVITNKKCRLCIAEPVQNIFMELKTLLVAFLHTTDFHTIPCLLPHISRTKSHILPCIINKNIKWLVDWGVISAYFPYFSHDRFHVLHYSSVTYSTFLWFFPRKIENVVFLGFPSESGVFI